MTTFAARGRQKITAVDKYLKSCISLSSNIEHESVLGSCDVDPAATGGGNIFRTLVESEWTF